MSPGSRWHRTRRKDRLDRQTHDQSRRICSGEQQRSGAPSCRRSIMFQYTQRRCSSKLQRQFGVIEDTDPGHKLGDTAPPHRHSSSSQPHNLQSSQKHSPRSQIKSVVAKNRRRESSQRIVAGTTPGLQSWQTQLSLADTAPRHWT